MPLPDPQNAPVNRKKAEDLHSVLEEAVPGNEAPQAIESGKRPGERIEKKHDMRVRCSRIGAREDAVHAPVVVDGVHRLYVKQQNRVRDKKEQKEKKISL